LSQEGERKKSTVEEKGKGTTYEANEKKACPSLGQTAALSGSLSRAFEILEEREDRGRGGGACLRAEGRKRSLQTLLPSQAPGIHCRRKEKEREEDLLRQGGGKKKEGNFTNCNISKSYAKGKEGESLADALGGKKGICLRRTKRGKNSRCRRTGGESCNSFASLRESSVSLQSRKKEKPKSRKGGGKRGRLSRKKEKGKYTG